MASDYQLIHFWLPRWFQNWQDSLFQIWKNQFDPLSIWLYVILWSIFEAIRSLQFSQNVFKWIKAIFGSLASCGRKFLKMHCIVMEWSAWYWCTRVKFYSRWVIKFSSYWKKPIHYQIHLRRQMKKGIQIENFIHTENNEKIQKI